MNLIVFDIDDTLTKSENQHQAAYVNTMLEFEITNIDQNWKNYKHHTDSYILKVNFENNKSDPFDFDFIEAFENRMTEIMLTLNKVSEINGAKDTVKHFNNNPEYAVSFATGSLYKPALIKLNQTGIEYHENVVVGSNKYFTREEIVQRAIGNAKTYYKVDSFDNIVSIGDGIWDLNTARNLGLHFIGIGSKNLADFESEGIQYHIHDWEEFSIDEMKNKFKL